MYTFQRQKSIVKSSKIKKVVLTSRSLTNYRQEKNIPPLSIIISETSYKIKLFRYAILIQDKKRQTFSLSHSTNHYSSIYKQNHLDGNFKIEIFFPRHPPFLRALNTASGHFFFRRAQPPLPC